MFLGACGSAFAVLACTKGFTARIPPGRCSRASKLVRGLKVRLRSFNHTCVIALRACA